jgi:flagellar biogenesis protein FliO
MDKCYEKFSDNMRLRRILCAAAILLFNSTGLLAENSLFANAPQSSDNALSSTSSKSLTIVSDQTPLIDEKISIKNSPSLSLQQNTSSQWDKQTLSRPKQTASGDTSTPLEKPSSYSGSLSVWRSMVSLLLVLLLIVGGSFLLRRFMPSANRFSKDSGLEILTRCAVGPKQSICLVKMGPRLVLVGLSPNHMAALDVVKGQEDIATILGQVETSAPESISSSFGKYFRQESVQFEEQAEEQSLDHPKDELDEVRQVHLARSELSGLLDKVKGLTRLRGRY